MGAQPATWSREARRGDMGKGKERLPYEPPAIQKVKIAKDELAVAICKSQTSRVGPTTGCFRSNCKAKGS
jgi:hypothetical protein